MTTKIEIRIKHNYNFINVFKKNVKKEKMEEFNRKFTKRIV